MTKRTIVVDTTKPRTVVVGDLCTIAWAASRLGVTTRQVLRYIEAGTLQTVMPRRGPGESARHKRILLAGDVRTLDVARTGHLRDDSRTCLASCPHGDHRG